MHYIPTEICTDLDIKLRTFPQISVFFQNFLVQYLILMDAEDIF